MDSPGISVESPCAVFLENNQYAFRKNSQRKFCTYFMDEASINSLFPRMCFWIEDPPGLPGFDLFFKPFKNFIDILQRRSD